MSNNSGTLLIAPIRPFSSNDEFPSAFSNELKGGHHQVNSLDDITNDRLQEGMLATVVGISGDNTTYQYNGGVWDIYLPNDSNQLIGSHHQVTDLSSIKIDKIREGMLATVVGVSGISGNNQTYQYNGGAWEKFSSVDESNDLIGGHHQVNSLNDIPTELIREGMFATIVGVSGVSGDNQTYQYNGGNWSEFNTISDISNSYLTTDYKTSSYTITHDKSTVVPVISISGGFDVIPNNNVDKGVRFKVHDVGNFCGTNPVTISGGSLGKINTDGGSIEFAMSDTGSWVLIDKFENIWDRNESTNEISTREGETLIANKLVIPSNGNGLEIKNSQNDIVVNIDDNGLIQAKSGKYGIAGSSTEKDVVNDTFDNIGSNVDVSVSGEFSNKEELVSFTDQVYTHTTGNDAPNTGYNMWLLNTTDSGIENYAKTMFSSPNNAQPSIVLSSSEQNKIQWIIDLGEVKHITELMRSYTNIGTTYMYGSNSFNGTTDRSLTGWTHIFNFSNSNYALTVDFNFRYIAFYSATTLANIQVDSYLSGMDFVSTLNTFDINLVNGSSGTFSPSTFLAYDENDNIINGYNKINISTKLDGGSWSSLIDQENFKLSSDLNYSSQFDIRIQLVGGQKFSKLNISTPNKTLELTNDGKVSFKDGVVEYANLSMDGFLPPQLTTSERDLITTPSTGLTIFNSTNNRLEAYNGTNWQIGLEFVSANETSKANLDSNFPASSNNGMYALIFGQTSQDGVYRSNGSLWSKIMDSSGDISDLWDFAGGVYIGTTNEARYNSNLGDAISSTLFGGQVASNGFDGNTSTSSRLQWNTNSGCWVGRKFTSPIVIGRIKFWNQAQSTNQTARDVSLYGLTSADETNESNWTKIDISSTTSGSITNGSIVNITETSGYVTLDTINVTAYVGYRLFIDQNNGNGVETQVTELEMYAAIDNTDLITPVNSINKLFNGYSNVTEISSDTTLTEDENFILGDSTSGDLTLTLPSVSTFSNKKYSIKKIDSSSNSVILSSTDLIDGDSSVTLSNQWDYIEIITDGTTWFISESIGGASATDGISYSQLIGDGSTNPITVHHNLGTRLLTYNIIDNTTYEVVAETEWDSTIVSFPTINTAEIEFASVPNLNRYTITFIGTVAGTNSISNAQVIGDGVTNPITINHNMGTRSIVCNIVNNNTYEVIGEHQWNNTTIEYPTLNTATIEFPTTATTNEYTVTLIAVGFGGTNNTNLSTVLHLSGGTMSGNLQISNLSPEFKVSSTTTSSDVFVADQNGIGVGVTPSPWQTYKVGMDIGTCGIMSHDQVDMTYLTSNAYFDGSWKYKQNNTATYYRQEEGRHYWTYAADGNANDPISWTTHMFLNEFGDLTIGKTTPDDISQIGSEVSATGYISASRSSGNTLFLNRKVDNGNLIEFNRDNNLVGSVSSTTTGTSFNITSDYRLKENVVPLDSALERIELLKPSRFNFIIDPEVTIDGFLAHEVQEVVPEAVMGIKDEVVDNEPVYQVMDQSKLIPLLVGAVKELKKRIIELENS